MRIGILSQWYDPETGGPAHPECLARRLRDRGHEVQVVTGFPNHPVGRLYDGYSMQRRPMRYWSAFRSGEWRSTPRTVVRSVSACSTSAASPPAHL